MNGVEFHQTRKTLAPFIDGPTAQMLTRRMDADFAEVHQTHSFAFSHEWPVEQAIETWIIQIPEDYYYHLNTVQFWIPAGTGDPVNLADLVHEIYDVGRNRALFTQSIAGRGNAIPVRIMVTPGDDRPVRYRVKVNHTFLPDSLIKVVVRYPDTTDWPETVYSMTEGIRIPKNFILDQ